MFPISLFLYDKLSMPCCLLEVLISHTHKKDIFQPSGHCHCCAQESWQETHPVFLRGWHLKAIVTGLAMILKHSERQRPHHLRKAAEETLQPLRGTAYKHARQPEGRGSTLLLSAFWDEDEWWGWELGPGRGFHCLWSQLLTCWTEERNRA